MFKRKAEEEPAGKVWRPPALAFLQSLAAVTVKEALGERDGAP